MCQSFHAHIGAKTNDCIYVNVFAYKFHKSCVDSIYFEKFKAKNLENSENGWNAMSIRSGQHNTKYFATPYSVNGFAFASFIYVIYLLHEIIVLLY